MPKYVDKPVVMITLDDNCQHINDMLYTNVKNSTDRCRVDGHLIYLTSAKFLLKAYTGLLCV